jgi:hypothetical protein
MQQVWTTIQRTVMYCDAANKRQRFTQHKSQPIYFRQRPGGVIDSKHHMTIPQIQFFQSRSFPTKAI